MHSVNWFSIYDAFKMSCLQTSEAENLGFSPPFYIVLVVLFHVQGHKKLVYFTTFSDENRPIYERDIEQTWAFV